MYQIVISKKAQKEIDTLPVYISGNVDTHILALADNPRPQGCKKLEGFKNAYRIRVGKYRIVYTIEDNILTVTIVAIRNRKDAYDDF